MSRDGPPASSFTEPRITGFLTKQGGQGIMSANWRKRYFVLDNHYLFYYKNKQDRKPVGVVCLSDYKSCHKASTKESKRSKFTFVIEKGDHTEQDVGYAIRNYYIYAENEADMNSWIESISREIASNDDFSRRGPKVDIKAFDELSTTVDGGLKLSHPTAARPKPQGRRPPRKYIPFNEEEEGASPRIQKRPMSDTSLEDCPSSVVPVRPSLMETHEDMFPKKGHHPSVAMVPKMKQTTSEDHTPDQDNEPPKETPPPPTQVSKPIPAPPPTSAKPKHRASIKESSPPPVVIEEAKTLKSPERQLDNEPVTKVQDKPLPPTANKPAPPPTKPKNKRSVTDVTKEGNDSVQEELTTSLEEQLPTDNTTSTSSSSKFSKPSPPRKLKKLVVEPSEGNVKPIPKPRTKSTTAKDKKDIEKRLSNEESTATSGSDLGSPVDETTPRKGVVQEDTSNTESLQEIGASLKEMKEFIQEVKETPIIAAEGGTEEVANSNPTVKTIGYENVTINLKQDGQLTISAPEGVKEDVEREIKETNKETHKYTEITIPIITTPPSSEASTTGTKDLSESMEHLDSNTISRSSPIPIDVNGGDALYDVPSPNKVTIRMSPDEEDGYDIPKLLRNDTPPMQQASPYTDTPPKQQIPSHTDTPTRQQVTSIDSDYDMPTTFGGVADETTPSNNLRLSDSTSPRNHISPERDAWGYAIVNKKRNQPSTESNGVLPSLAADTLAAHVQVPEDIASIPMNLHKAKEILRLAMIVKTEVLEMRQEVESELAIARRERHDSQLMKQNAAEILKMAKDVLQRVQSS